MDATTQTRMVDAKTIAEQFEVSPATVARWHRLDQMPRGLVINRRTIRWPADVIDRWISPSDNDKDTVAT